MNPSESGNPAVAYCRVCGKGLTTDAQRPMHGTVYCAEHAPAAGSAPPPAPAPWTTATESGISPGLAFLLGLIPGVGAIYNAQYAKGLVHMLVFGMLISILSSGAAGSFEPMFGMLAPGWVFYMAFEAYHTARKRMQGETVDEFSSLVPLRGTGFPVVPILLIALGTVFLLHNLEIIRLYQVLKYWPAFLIALGVYMLYVRMTENSPAAPPREASNER